LLSATSAAAQTRTITGRVSDSATTQPLTVGQVFVAGTSFVSTIKDDGSFAVQAPSQAVTLSVRSIGYKRANVPVRADQASVQIGLAKDYFQLEAVVVTGQVTSIERKNLSIAVSTVDAEALTQAPTPSIEAALQGKVAGGQFLNNTGAPGGGMRVQLRGVTTVIGQNSPLYVVDGLVVSDVAISPGTNPVTRASGSALDAGNQESPVNRIADLNPNDIETIEVLKGAAASAIYGSKASNGVILVTTKKGRAGAPTFTVLQRVGRSQLSFKNGYRRFQTLADATNAFGPQAANFWKQDYTAYNLEDYIYDNHPLSHETMASVSGGTETTRYFVSGEMKHDGGIVLNTYADKDAMRLNVDQTITPRITLALNTNVVHTSADRGLFGNDNSATTLGEVVNNVPNFIDLRATCPDGSRQVLCEGGVYPVNPFQASNPLQTAALLKIPETVWRNITTARLEYQPLQTQRNSIRVLVTGGADIFNQKDVVDAPPELQFAPANGLPGTHAIAYSQNINYSASANLVHQFTPLSGAFRATTSVGVQKESRDLSVSRSVGQNLLGGVLSLQTATNFTLGETRTRVVDAGAFAQEELLMLHERLFLTAGIRADQTSNDGRANESFYYPKASASYRLSLPHVEEAKLRVAYGQSGNQPLYGQKFTNLQSSNQDGIGGFQIAGTAGAADIKPERQREIEVGFDGTLLDSRVNLDLTWFEKRITDLLLNRSLAASTGYSSERFNGGVMRTRGTEAAIGLVPIRNQVVTWNARLTWAQNRSLIMSLPVPSFQIGGSFQRGSNIIQEGHSPTELWGNDTLPGASKGTIQIAVVSIGDQTPRYSLGLTNDLTFKSFSFHTLLDQRKGTLLAAGTRRRAVQAKNSPDYDEPGVLSGKLGDEQLLYNPSVTRVFVDDASFIKLREARIGWDLPRSVVDRLHGRARYLRLNLSGRDLWQHTPYRGGDPEVTNFGFSDALGGVREVGIYPPSRSFWLTLDWGF
jgi:TonB-linked SusC/RagA family outer membrane protein